MATPKVYVVCDQKCLYEGMTKEQILTAITQAVNEGTIGDIDIGFVQTIKTINGTALRFFVGTQAEYEALPDADKENLFAVITNDTTKDNLNAVIEQLLTNFDELYNGLVSGSFIVDKAKKDKYGNEIDKAYIRWGDRMVRYAPIGGDALPKSFATKALIGEIPEDQTLDCISCFSFVMKPVGGTAEFKITGIKTDVATQDSNGKYVKFHCTGQQINDTNSGATTLFMRFLQAEAKLYLVGDLVYLVLDECKEVALTPKSSSLVHSETNMLGGSYTLERVMYWLI